MRHQSRNDILLYEVSTGQMRHTLKGHQGPVGGGVFSADGTIFVSTSQDGTALVWDMAGRSSRRHVSAQQLETSWAALAGADAVKAYEGIRIFAASPAQAVAFLSQRLPPVVPLAPKRAVVLLAELASADFAVRDKAERALERAGLAAEPALRQALKKSASEETRRRLERVLRKLDGPETLRMTRAIEALELIRTRDARRHLEALADGPAEARLTKEAGDALARLRKVPANQE